MWVMGGLVSGSVGKNDVWSSTDGVNWTEVLADGDAPWLARFTHQAVVYDGKMWVMGGQIGSGVKLNDVWHTVAP